ncbi:methionine sulfoxide reductase A [Suhomyces tanzawaensis NRRL Y-17324]|uniref:peptide-methionine (S)-S-oxide reductase n=1 Tax=Suhomyces tanzawaensis NRRL Y-17324 TaxID=984487 RepID=A0A1E4SLP8_9ASCO|nr:methionine sulfoxide reductase A [Suhomyces tanzawaensis NRRL Y-17324]ODV80440.1 methionine sulfoxide reductase A [Suhomyces tanzawaensis NRRL Y-17324]
MTTTTLSPSIKASLSAKYVTLAAGCFWGVERVFRKHFGHKGLLDVRVGYANGVPTAGNVNYESVCTGKTNFVESVQIAYDPSLTNLKELLDIFFRMHDPTTVNAQGPDVGVQYRSAVLTHDEEDQKLAWEVKDDSKKVWYPNHEVVTIIEPIKIWYDAEDYHQQYLQKNPGGYECPSHFIRTKPKV